MSEFLIGLINPSGHPQVNQFFKRCRYPATVSHGEKVIVVKHDEIIIGAAKMWPRKDDTWLLRAICIHPDWRGQGIGTKVLQEIPNTLNEDYCYCFVYNHLIDFYEASGFSYPAFGSVPDDLTQAYEHYCDEGRKLVLMVRYPNRQIMNG